MGARLHYRGPRVSADDLGSMPVFASYKTYLKLTSRPLISQQPKSFSVTGLFGLTGSGELDRGSGLGFLGSHPELD